MCYKTEQAKRGEERKGRDTENDEDVFDDPVMHYLLTEDLTQLLVLTHTSNTAVMMRDLKY